MYNQRSAPDYKPENDSNTGYAPPDASGDNQANPGMHGESQNLNTSQNYLVDLGDLDFGPLGDEQKYLALILSLSQPCSFILRNLPPPLRPSALRGDSSGAESDPWKGRGSLSDLSDYESSDEETHNAASGSSQRKPGRRSYVQVSDDPDEDGRDATSNVEVKGKRDDPFSDPVA